MPAYRVTGGEASQLAPEPFRNERELQRFFEANLETLLGVRFVATEFSTGQKHGGRIDSLGLDESGNPVIVEYKWDKGESVINQGLFYLDWLIDHHGDFAMAVQAKLGTGVEVSWSGPRLIIIAASYTKYDSYAVNQLSPSIELLRYRRYTDGFVVIENVLDPIEAAKSKAAAVPMPVAAAAVQTPVGAATPDTPSYGLEYHLEKTSGSIASAFLDLRERILALDGVEERANQKVQISYRTTKSFAAFDFKPDRIDVQFKGGESSPAHNGVAIKNIRKWGWGYPWMCYFREPDDIDAVFEIVKSAYSFEQ